MRLGGRPVSIYHVSDANGGEVKEPVLSIVLYNEWNFLNV